MEKNLFRPLVFFIPGIAAALVGIFASFEGKNDGIVLGFSVVAAAFIEGSTVLYRK